MKVCITIDEQLHQALKIQAAKTCKTISELAESAIMNYLSIVDEDFDMTEMQEKVNSHKGTESINKFKEF